MQGVVGIVAFFTVLILSLVITRIATVALTLTGLSTETAKFQARSAFTGTGFTTTEAEHVVDHPVRRRIVMWLMVARSAGLVTILISLILSFAGPGEDIGRLLRLGYLIAGVAALWGLSRSNFLGRHLERAIEWALRRWTNLEARDYENLLKLSGAYRVQELRAQEDDWIADKTLQDCRLMEEGVLVLGIYRRDGSYLGAPRGKTRIYSGDTLILYGRENALHDLNQRRSDPGGEMAHDRAVSEQRERESREEARDREYRKKRKAEAATGDAG